MCVYGTKVNLKENPNVIYQKDFKQLLTSFEWPLSAPRSIFCNAMFTKKDIIPNLKVILEVPDNHELWIGYSTSKQKMVSNFTNWVISKTNPFKDKPRFDLSVKNFLKIINGRFNGFPYYFLDDSVIFEDFENDNNPLKAGKKFVESSINFYDDVRNGKKYKEKDLENALDFTYWTIKKGKPEIYDGDIDEIEWLYFQDL